MRSGVVCAKFRYPSLLGANQFVLRYEGSPQALKLHLLYIHDWCTRAFCASACIAVNLCHLLQRTLTASDDGMSLLGAALPRLVHDPLLAMISHVA